MFSIEEVIHFHDEAINRYGGSKGIRDINNLDAALHRPWQTFDAHELYPSCFEKAAAVLQSIIMNHPFIDGNKRTAFILCESLLQKNSYTIDAATEIIYDFLVDISTGKYHIEQITSWLQQHTTLTSQP